MISILPFSKSEIYFSIIFKLLHTVKNRFALIKQVSKHSPGIFRVMAGDFKNDTTCKEVLTLQKIIISGISECTVQHLRKIVRINIEVILKTFYVFPFVILIIHNTLEILLISRNFSLKLADIYACLYISTDRKLFKFPLRHVKDTIIFEVEILVPECTDDPAIRNIC